MLQEYNCTISIDDIWMKSYFTITAEILVRSLANFQRQYADRHMNL